MSPVPWAQRLAVVGHRQLRALAPHWALLEETKLVSPQSALLCAALCELALSCHRGLGGDESRAEEVAQAAAMLSLLTKVDDQVIDAPEFHGAYGPSQFKAKREAVRRFLEPTKRAIFEASAPVGAEARVEFGAELGRRLRRLAADESRLQDILDQIEWGWEVQARAVSLLTSTGVQAGREEVGEVTGQISGAWLMMIAAVGSLPEDAERLLSARERAAFGSWGGWIQRADALADYDKDLAEGHLSAWPNLVLYERFGLEALRAQERRDLPKLYAMLARGEVDLDSMPDRAELMRLRGELSALEELGQLLAWIHGFLTRRYLQHPTSARSVEDERFALVLAQGRDAEEFLESRRVEAERRSLMGAREAPELVAG